MVETRPSNKEYIIGVRTDTIRKRSTDSSLIHEKHEYRFLHCLIYNIYLVLGMATAATITIILLHSANIYAVKFIVASSMLLTFPILIIIFYGLDQLYLHKSDKVEKCYIVTWGVMHAVILVMWLVTMLLVNVNYNPLIDTSALSSLVWVK